MSDNVAIWLALVFAFAGGMVIGAYLMHAYMLDKRP